MLECETIDETQLGRLLAFLSPLLVVIETLRHRRLAKAYVDGLLGPAERKTAEPIVRTALGVDRAPSRERRMQEMLSDGEWNHRSLTFLGAEKLLPAADFEAYTLDDTAILKQGTHSVGVANQYAGCVGGLANCQSIVTAGIAGEHVSALFATQLFLPASWCTPEAAARREAARIPPRVTHRTKAQIGLDIIHDTALWGFPKRPWLCDSAYGDNTAFRLALDSRGETYVAGASLTLTMWPPGTTFTPVARKPGAGRPPTHLRADHDVRPLRVDILAAGLPPTAWESVLWRHGSRGPQRGRFATMRVRPARGATTKSSSRGTIGSDDLQPEQWLLIHWPDGEPRPTKAWLSNLPDDTPLTTLVALGRLRWRIERDHEEDKGLVGFDHYEGRTWPGLHHHLALVLVAAQFLAFERLRELAMERQRDAPTSSNLALPTAAPAAFPPCIPAVYATAAQARTSTTCPATPLDASAT